MRNWVICLFCLAGMMLSLAGCETTFEQKGREVKFTATSKGGVLTKTAYDTETSGYAPIKWEDTDVIRIYSPNEDFILNHDGQIHTNTGIEGEGYSYVYADYNLEGFSSVGHLRKATLANILLDDQGHTSSLYWKTTSGNATFYGVYPTTTGINWFKIGGLAFKVMIPSDQTVTFTNGVHSPSISSLPLIAMQQNVISGTPVDLNFYPAFTAFEFNLKSKQGELTLNSLTLKINDEEGDAPSKNGYLTGACIYAPALEKKAGDPFYILNSKIFYFDEINKETASDPCQKELTITFPDATTISTTNQVTFTLFALPNDISKASITINLTADGQTKSRTLKLQDQRRDENDNLVVDANGKPVYDWITFEAGHKARIKGLAVDGGSKWQLEIDGQVLPWTSYEETIDQQISFQPYNKQGDVYDGRAVVVDGAIESQQKWLSPGGSATNAAGLNKDNHYADTNWKLFGETGYGVGTGNYDKNYQIRTLDNRLGENDRYFTMSFCPTAPTGGYWKLIPKYHDGDDVSPQHFRFEVVMPDGTTSNQLTGPIINSWFTVKIIPVDWTPSTLATYDVWFECFVSPSVNFTPSLNADSEFQDVHGDGRFSYWVFRLAYYTEDYHD